MENKGLLTMIAVILLGIFTVLLVQVNEETPSEKLASSLDNAVEKIGD